MRPSLSSVARQDGVTGGGDATLQVGGGSGGGPGDAPGAPEHTHLRDWETVNLFRTRTI